MWLAVKRAWYRWRWDDHVWACHRAGSYPQGHICSTAAWDESPLPTNECQEGLAVAVRYMLVMR